MAVPQAVRDEYQRYRADYDSLERYAVQTVLGWCKPRDYSVSSRIKEVESLSEKLEGGYISRWSEIDDLVGLTVVVPTLLHEPVVVEYLDTAFVRRAVRSRETAQTPPEVFRFNATRWYGVARTDPPPPELSPGAHGVVLEVQIHTVFEHAWSVATRDFAFKAEQVKWRQMRLAAGLKAMVEQIDALIADFERTAAAIPEAPFPPTDAKAHVVSVFRELIEEGVVDASLQPESWARFSDNVYELVRREQGGPTTPDDVRALVDEMAATVRACDLVPAVAGSLYQAVVAHIHRVAPGRLRRTCIVPSDELQQLYGVEIPNAFVFDGHVS